jgi:hypothetical protein
MAAAAPQADRLDNDVHVLHDDGRWYPGTLEHWRCDHFRWRGFVRYRLAGGVTLVGWFDQDHIRTA